MTTRTTSLHDSTAPREMSLFVADNEMDHAGGIGDPEAVEIFPELFHFIAARDAVDFQIRRSGFGVIRFQLEPDIGMAQVRHPIDPEPVRAELENAALFFFLDQRQPKRVAVKSEHLLVSVARTFDRDVRAAGKLWTVDVGGHDLVLELRQNFLCERLRFFGRSFRVFDAADRHRDERVPLRDVKHQQAGFAQHRRFFAEAGKRFELVLARAQFLQLFHRLQLARRRLAHAQHERFARVQTVIIAAGIVTVRALGAPRLRVLDRFAQNRRGIGFGHDRREIDLFFRRGGKVGDGAKKGGERRPGGESAHRLYPPAAPSPPGSVIATGSSARARTAGGNTFRSRQISRTVLPVFALSFAISAARSYPISGARLVTIAMESSTNSRQRSSFASIPITHFSQNASTTLVRSRMLSRRLCAITGIITFNSKFPFAPDQVMQVSLPMTCAQTIMSDSHMTGFTLPGMIELPGCVAGRRISPMPQRGPLPSQRMSFAILNRLTAIVFSWPLASTTASLPPCASK